MQKKVVWTILILIHLVFFGAAIYINQSSHHESNEFIQQAKNIRSDFSWYAGDLNSKIDPALYCKQPPLYGIFLAITWWPLSGDTPVFIFQILLGLFNCLLAYHIASSFFKNEIKTLLFFFPFLFYLQQFAFTNSINPLVFIQASWLFAVFYGIKFLKEYKTKDLILHQVAVTVSLLIKPVAYAFPLLSTAGLILLIMKRKISPSVLSTTLIPIAVIAFIIGLNFKNTKVIEYSSVQRHDLLYYSMPELLSKSRSHYDTYLTIDSIKKNSSTMDYPTAAQYTDQQCLKWIKENPSGYFWLYIKDFFRVFLDAGRWNIYKYFKEAGIAPDFKSKKQASPFKSVLLIYVLFCVLMNLILMITFFRFLFLKNIEPRIRSFLALMVFYILLFTGPATDSGLKIIVYPVLLIIFSAVVNSSLEKKKLKVINK